MGENYVLIGENCVIYVETFINCFLFLSYEVMIMGRIKTMLIKRTTGDLIEKYGEEFTQNFDENKKILDSKTKITSKKMRNIIAGYATRLKKTGR